MFFATGGDHQLSLLPTRHCKELEMSPPKWNVKHIGVMLMFLALLAFMGPLIFEAHNCLFVTRNEWTQHRASVQENNAGSLCPVNELENTLVSMEEKVVCLTHRLEKTDLRFYMYDDPTIERPDMKESLLKGEGRPILLKRYKGFALSEVHMLEHFKTHPLRTFDPMEADLYIIPLSVSTILTQALKPKIAGEVYETAFGALYNTSTFQSTMGHRHVLLVQTPPIYSHAHIGMFRNYFGLSQHYEKLWNVTIGKDHDQEGCREAYQRSLANGSDFQADLWEKGQFMSRSGFSLGFIPPDTELFFQPASSHRFMNASLHFFYRTRREPSAFNSTPYRHALVTNDTIAALPNSSIGFDIPPEQYLREYPNAKYCLVIRGDNPNSRALLRAIKVGCIPVVVSDLLEAYGASLKSTVSLQDYSVSIDERTFLKDPLVAILGINEMLVSDIEDKIRALAFAQRVLLPDSDDSLFVPAVLYEAHRAWKQGLSLTSYPW